jgi:hypothetical protein
VQPPAIITLSRLRWIAAAIIAGALARGSAVDAADRVNWLTGAALQQQLAEPVDILWADNPLHQAMVRLSRACRVAILIDRRVDPGQKLDVSLRGVPLESALQTIARGRGLGVSRLGAVVYLGPLPAAERLPAVAAGFDKQVRLLPPAVQRRYHQLKALAWEDLATPRELLSQLGRQGGLEIANLEQAPHDLWAAADLPPLSLVDRLTLVAIQFDLTFHVTANGSRLELVPAPGGSYGPSKDLQPTPQRDRGLAGPRVPASGRTVKPAGGQDRFQIDVREKPLGPVLRQLADRLDLDLRIDQQAIRTAGISLDQRVSVHLQNATVDEILGGLLRDTGLSFHRRQRVIEIVPAEQETR